MKLVLVSKATINHSIIAHNRTEYTLTLIIAAIYFFYTIRHYSHGQMWTSAVVLVARHWQKPSAVRVIHWTSNPVSCSGTFQKAGIHRIRIPAQHRGNTRFLTISLWIYTIEENVLVRRGRLRLHYVNAASVFHESIISSVCSFYMFV